MKYVNTETMPFERWLEAANASARLSTRSADTFIGAAVDVNDTLEAAWASAREVFGDKATPEQALKICKMMFEREGWLRAYAEANDQEDE